MNYAPEVALKATFTMGASERGKSPHCRRCNRHSTMLGGGRQFRWLFVLFIKFALFVDNHNLVFGEVYDLNIALDMSLSLFKLKGFPVLGEDFVYISPDGDKVGFGRLQFHQIAQIRFSTLKQRNPFFSVSK